MPWRQPPARRARAIAKFRIRPITCGTGPRFTYRILWFCACPYCTASYLCHTVSFMPHCTVARSAPGILRGVTCRARKAAAACRHSPGPVACNLILTDAWPPALQHLFSRLTHSGSASSHLPHCIKTVHVSYVHAVLATDIFFFFLPGIFYPFSQPHRAWVATAPCHLHLGFAFGTPHLHTTQFAAGTHRLPHRFLGMLLLLGLDSHSNLFSCHHLFSVRGDSDTRLGRRKMGPMVLLSNLRLVTLREGLPTFYLRTIRCRYWHPLRIHPATRTRTHATAHAAEHAFTHTWSLTCTTTRQTSPLRPSHSTTDAYEDAPFAHAPHLPDSTPLRPSGLQDGTIPQPCSSQEQTFSPSVRELRQAGGPKALSL